MPKAIEPPFGPPSAVGDSRPGTCSGSPASDQPVGTLSAMPAAETGIDPPVSASAVGWGVGAGGSSPPPPPSASAPTTPTTTMPPTIAAGMMNLRFEEPEPDSSRGGRGGLRRRGRRLRHHALRHLRGRELGLGHRHGRRGGHGRGRALHGLAGRTGQRAGSSVGGREGSGAT